MFFNNFFNFCYTIIILVFSFIFFFSITMGILNITMPVLESLYDFILLKIHLLMTYFTNPDNFINLNNKEWLV